MRILAWVCLLLAALSGYSGEPPTLVNVAYRTGMQEPKLDFYAPESKGFPTVVHIYGSGWRSGSGKSSAPVAEALRRHGVGCVLVSHRLAPAHTIHEQAGDVAAAFAWAKAHVAEKGGDPAKIFLSGHSTGGQLILLVATEPTYLAAEHLSISDIAGIVALSAPVDLVPRGDGHSYGDIMSGPRGKGVFPTDREEITKLSPLHQLNGKIPRTLLLVGSDDFPMLADDARRFAQKAKALGADISTDVIAGKDHMGMIRALTNEEDPVFLRVLAFIQAQPNRPQ